MTTPTQSSNQTVGAESENMAKQNNLGGSGDPLGGLPTPQAHCRMRSMSVACQHQLHESNWPRRPGTLTEADEVKNDEVETAFLEVGEVIRSQTIHPRQLE